MTDENTENEDMSAESGEVTEPDAPPTEDAPAEEPEPLAAEVEAVDTAPEEAAGDDAGGTPARVTPTAEAAGESDAAAEPDAAAARKKKKRLPRSERPHKTRRTREKAAERKPVVRLPKPEHVRGRRQERQGTVVSAGADKTIVVRVDVVKAHPTYKKVIKRSTRLHAHDERNEAKPGDVVRIVETRPLSKLKRWRLQEIVEAAK